MTALWWVLPIAAFALSVAATRMLWQPGAPFTVVDLPNERSLHVRPTPRTGGLAIVSVVAIAWCALALTAYVEPGFGWITLAAVAVVAISFADDRGGVKARYRFAVHAGAAVTLVVGGLGLESLPLPGVTMALGVVGAALTFLFVVWMTNLYNFMDGMDGFAGGMAASGFAFLGYAFFTHGQVTTAIATLIVTAAAAGFLVYNFPPARIFLGDVGSAPLGFVAAAFMLHAERSGAAPLWTSILAFSPFIVDATVTLFRRALRREKVWLPHRSHFYQRLVIVGWGHRRTVLAEYVAMLACTLGAVSVLHASASTQWITIASYAAAYVVAMLLVTRLERKSEKRLPDSAASVSP